MNKQKMTPDSNSSSHTNIPEPPDHSPDHSIDETIYYKNLAKEMKSKLDEIENSISFRIGRAFSDVMKEPLKKSIKLPIVLWRIFHDYLYIRKISNSNDKNLADQAIGSQLRNKKIYLHPNTEEHLFRAFPDYTPLQKYKNSSLRIACVFEDDFYKCLDFESHLIPLDPKNWQKQMESQRPDIFIAQSTLHFRNNAWRHEFIKDSGPGPILKHILSYCKKNNIPTAFWDTEDKIHFPYFQKSASLFEHILVTDTHNFKSYQALHGSKNVSHLTLSIQPALHNDIKHDNLTFKNKGFSILFDGWADILEWPHKYKFLKKLFKDGLHIVESRYKFMANKLDDLPDFRENIMGHLTGQQLLSAFKAYNVILISEDSLSSSLSLAKKAIEAAACGASVIYKGSKNELIPDHIVTYVKSDNEIIDLCKQFLKEEQDNEIHKLKNKRTLFSKHTYAHSLQTICRKLGVEHFWKEFPLVSIITPTKRPENFETAFESYKNQKYPHKEWIIILNSSRNTSENIKKICEKKSDIRILQLHEEKNIGTCLNIGIEKANGDYWFKMDDDDFYGPNYVSDMMLETRSIDADVFGKPRGFVYFKKTNRLILRSDAMASQFIYTKENNAPHICGATISGKKSVFSEIKFSEERRANVDTDFIKLCINKPGTSVYLSNVYGFVTVREKDSSKHTWATDEKSLKHASSYFGDKKDINKIMD